MIKSSAHFFRLPPAAMESRPRAPKAGGRGVVAPKGHWPGEKTAVVAVDGHWPAEETGVAGANGHRPSDETGVGAANGRRPWKKTGAGAANGHWPFGSTTTFSPIFRRSAPSSRPTADPSPGRRLLRRRRPAIPPPVAFRRRRRGFLAVRRLPRRFWAAIPASGVHAGETGLDSPYGPGFSVRGLDNGGNKA